MKFLNTVFTRSVGLSFFFYSFFDVVVIEE